MAQKILVVAAHSDDEAIGVSGTIARHVRDGDEVHIIFLTDGVGARGSGAHEADARASASQRAATIMGVSSVTQLSFPDNRIDTVPLIDVVQRIEDHAKTLSADIVYTHHSGDLNVDHRACHQAVLTAFRPSPGQTVHSIYGFEVASSSEWAFCTDNPFQPTHFVDISQTLDIKIQVLQAYFEEMRTFPHPRSEQAIVALAVWRGATVGCSAAEAFTTIRTIAR